MSDKSPLDPTTAKELFKEAVACHQQGKLEQAQQLYIRLLVLEPNHSESHYNLATILSQLGHWDAAIEHYKKALTRSPKAASIHYNLAIAYLKNKSLFDAITHLQQSLQENPDHCEAEHLLACLYLHTNQADKAKTHFMRALAINPRDAQAHFNFAVLLLKIQQYDKALAHFKQAINIQPAFIEAHYNCGVVYQQKNHISAAISAFEEALSISPDYFDAHYQLVLLYQDKQEIKKAIDHCAAALKLIPDDPCLKFLHHALTQTSIPEKAPADYLRRLFDRYADYYDHHMQETLNYHTPQAIVSALNNLSLLPKKPTWTCIDLGCGTGLMGIALHTSVKKLVGVDISHKMLDKAREKAVYHQLIEDELEHFLINYQEPVDLIVAAEVMNYIGNLSELFSQCQRIIKKEGLWVFTTEISDHKYQLQTVGRYGHANEYIMRLAKNKRFTCLLNKSIHLRRQQDYDLVGMLTILKKD